MNFLQISMLKLILLLISSIRAQIDSSKECKKKAGDLIIKTNPVIVEERKEGSKITTIQIREDRYLGSLTCHILQDSGQSFQTHFSAESTTEFPGSSYDIFRFGKPLPKKRFFDCDIFLSNIDGLSEKEISIDLDVVLLLQPLTLNNAAGSNPCTNPIVSRKTITIILPGKSAKDDNFTTTFNTEDITPTESFINPSNLGPTLTRLTSNPTRATTWSSTFSPVNAFTSPSKNDLTTVPFIELTEYTSLSSTSVSSSVLDLASSLPKDETTNLSVENSGIKLSTVSTKAEIFSTPKPITPSKTTSLIYQPTHKPEKENSLALGEDSFDVHLSFTSPTTETIDIIENSSISSSNSNKSVLSTNDTPNNDSSKKISPNDVEVEEDNLPSSLPTPEVESSEPEKAATPEDESLNNEGELIIPQPENDGSTPIGIYQGEYDIPSSEEESLPEEEPISSKDPSNENATLIAGPPNPVNSLNQGSTSSTLQSESKDQINDEEDESSTLFWILIAMGILLLLFIIWICFCQCCPNLCCCLLGNCCKNRVKSETSSREDLQVVSIRDNDGHIISTASTIDIIKRNHMKTYPISIQTDDLDKRSPRPPLILTPVSTTTGMQTDQLASSLTSRLPYSYTTQVSSNDKNVFLRQTSGTSESNISGLVRRPSVVPMLEENDNNDNQKEMIEKVLSAMTPKDVSTKDTPVSFISNLEKESSQTESVRSPGTSSELSSPFPRPIYLRDPPVRSEIFLITSNDETDDDELDCNPDCKVHIGHPESSPTFPPPTLSTLKELQDSWEDEEYQREKINSSDESSIEVLERNDVKEHSYNDSFSENIGFLNMAVQQLLQKEIQSKNPLACDSDSESDSTTTRIYLHDSNNEEISNTHKEESLKDEISDSELFDDKKIPGPCSASDSELNRVTIPLNALFEEEKAKNAIKEDNSSHSGSSSPPLEQLKSRRQSTSMAELTKFDLNRPKQDKMIHDDRFSITTTSI